MSEFDPAKEAANLAKHGISLARWIDLKIHAIVRDDRFNYGEPRFRVYGHIEGTAYCLVSPSAVMAIAPSVCGAPMPRK